MTFGKATYEFVAAVLRHERDELQTLDVGSPTAILLRESYYLELDCVVDAFTSAFGKNNDRFNPDRFRKACGLVN